jgi:hypothetical protein
MTIMTPPPDTSRKQPQTPAKAPYDDASRTVPERHVIPGLAVLLTVAALAAGIALVVGPGHPRWPAAVAFALACCLPGAVLGWTLTRLPSPDPARAVAGPLAAVTLRILPPLAALGWLSTGGQGLREAGAAGLLVAFYLTLLATDLLLHVVAREPGAGDSKAPH